MWVSMISEEYRHKLCPEPKEEQKAKSKNIKWLRPQIKRDIMKMKNNFEPQNPDKNEWIDSIENYYLYN